MLSEIAAIAREMVRIPASLYMRAAEAAGAGVLAAWRIVQPYLAALWRLLVRLFEVLEREVTPLRATLAVAAVVAVALALSQFASYRSIAIGAGDYTDVELVASAPPVDTATTGSAHAWIGLPLALAALAVVAACATRRLQTAWLLAPIGLVTIAVSLLIDAPKGLDEGEAAVAYQGAEASLLGGFWAQIGCGVLLVVLAPLLTGLMRSAEGVNVNAGARTQPRFATPVGEGS